MEQLLDPLYVGLHIINLIVMVVILRLLVYKPMKKFMDKRRAAVAEETRAADEALAAAQLKTEQLEQQKKELEQTTRSECYTVLSKAHAQAEEIISAAHRDAEDIAQAAHAQAEETARQAKEQQRQAAAALAVDVAAAVLPGQLSLQQQEELLKASLEEASKHEL